MSHKYAQIERERRWLLAQQPASLEDSTNYNQINDRYIIGTPLRLRQMTDADGQITALKLTQKYQGFTGGSLVEMTAVQCRQLLQTCLPPS